VRELADVLLRVGKREIDHLFRAPCSGAAGPVP